MSAVRRSSGRGGSGGGPQPRSRLRSPIARLNCHLRVILRHGLRRQLGQARCRPLQVTPPTEGGPTAQYQAVSDCGCVSPANAGRPGRQEIACIAQQATAPRGAQRSAGACLTSRSAASPAAHKTTSARVRHCDTPCAHSSPPPSPPLSPAHPPRPAAFGAPPRTPRSTPARICEPGRPPRDYGPQRETSEGAGPAACSQRACRPLRCDKQ